jgi:hypothetical protein
MESKSSVGFAFDNSTFPELIDKFGFDGIARLIIGSPINVFVKANN